MLMLPLPVIVVAVPGAPVLRSSVPILSEVPEPCCALSVNVNAGAPTFQFPNVS
jgi:hypothetical protein